MQNERGKHWCPFLLIIRFHVALQVNSGLYNWELRKHTSLYWKELYSWWKYCSVEKENYKCHSKRNEQYKNINVMKTNIIENILKKTIIINNTAIKMRTPKKTVMITKTINNVVMETWTPMKNVMEKNNIYYAIIEKRSPNKTLTKKNNINRVVMEKRSPIQNVIETNNIYYVLMETRTLKKN